MASFTVKPQELEGVLRRENERVRAAIPAAARAAAMRFAAYLADQIDDKGITDRGILKGSIQVTKNADGGASTTITAPHAGVVELGARPHGISPEAREAIKDWAMRKLGLDEKEAEAASWGIAHKIRNEGQQPTYVVRDSMPAAARFFGQELVRILNSRRAS
jgi:hypothetical protein